MNTRRLPHSFSYLECLTGKLCGMVAWFFALLAIFWEAHLSEKYF